MKKTLSQITVLIIVGVIFVLAGCATMGATSPETFEATIKATWEKYSAAMIAGDADNWIKLWDDNGVQLPPNAPMVDGKAAIKKRIQGFFAAMKVETFVIRISKTFVDHKFGFAYGNYTFTLVPRAGGEKIFGDGKYETIFRKQPDGSWKIFRDCFNSNVPPE